MVLVPVVPIVREDQVRAELALQRLELVLDLAAQEREEAIAEIPHIASRIGPGRSATSP